MAPPRVSGVRRLGVLLQQAREPVFVLDGQRRLLFVNRAWEELTGYDAGAVSGLACVPSGPSAERDTGLAGLGGSFSPPTEALAGRPVGGVTLIVRPGGERLWRRVEYWPYHDERGGLIGLVGLVRPVEAPPHAADSDSQRLRAELLGVRERLRGRYGVETLIGRGPGHRRVLEQVRAAGTTDVPVLVVGESGTGRRTVARAIHAASRGESAPLLPFDCAALPSELLERELFGEAEGPSTSPVADRPSGTALLLIEVADLKRDLQARLAALAGQEGLRLLATSTLDPDRALAQDRLRPDLYYALTTLVIRLPPLRDRLEELPMLAQHMLERRNARKGDRHSGFDAEALEVLAQHDWPGNLRELDRVVDHACNRAEGDLIRSVDLPAAIRGHLGAAYAPPTISPPRTPLDDTLTRVERRLIERALAQARQNKSRAAELLDISRPRLYRRIKELNIPDEPEAPEGSPVGEPAPGA